MQTHVVLQADPLLVPALLLLTGLLGLLLASIRGRTATRRRRWLRAGYSLLAAVAILASLGMATYRAQLFWAITWNGGSETLVLDRVSPLGEIRVPRSEVTAITEFSTPERSLSGPRRAVRFVVRTRSGENYWSAPLYSQVAIDATRLALINATRGRLERFLVGTDS